MWRSRRVIAIAGVLIAGLVLASLFVSPGFRHAHENGGAAHTHLGQSPTGSQDHGPGSHTHSHGSGHRHSHDNDSHSHFSHHRAATEHFDADPQELAESHSHIHISFLWFELTLPDWTSGRRSATSARPAEADAAASDVVVISSPFSIAQLVHVLLLSFGPLPEITSTPVDRLACYGLFPSGTLDQRLPDDVPVPPAELS